MHTEDMRLNPTTSLKYPFIYRIVQRSYYSLRVSSAYDQKDMDDLMRYHASITHHDECSRCRHHHVTSVLITLLSARCKTLRILVPKVVAPWIKENPDPTSQNEKIETVGDAFATLSERVAYVLIVHHFETRTDGDSRCQTHVHLADLTDSNT